ncbi:flagellar biosynthesis protein FlhA [Dinoroseobacter sp. S124A]|uniref:flagellar biosynthesis protein FlhA n=1 Tax=Dinoroseobacter sp. S124A TaxID=3415128 RepID=UPI003C7AD27B
MSAESLAAQKGEGRKIVQPTIFFVVLLMGIIIMMILPMPSFVLDVGLALSFALAILIFTVTLFIQRPLDFSAFPTVLLASLMLRLSLNVSSTKLIIGNGHEGTGAAGGVIEGFANFVMGGSVFLGLVVFLVLLIVNFIVITKGASRMAEVGARFALDGMPGKQLAIDADMSAGAIDHAEAKQRREIEQAETTFFGSLDGASKFVKGDAIAGLLITALNLVMGLIIGTTLHDMPFGEAFRSYSILTVGDGLVTQIPAVIISIAAALLLAKGGSSEKADIAITAQFGKHPAALATVAFMMFLFALVPGLPFVPFMLGAALLGVAALLLYRSEDAAEPENALEAPTEDSVKPETMGDVLDVDDIHVTFSTDLVSAILDSAGGLDSRIQSMRNHIATEFGVILPEIRLTDDPTLPASSYAIHMHGVEEAQGVLHPGRILLLLPEEGFGEPTEMDVKEPVYGAPARWIDEKDREEMSLLGMTTVAATEVLATHLLEVMKANLARLMSLKALRRLISELTNTADPARNEGNRMLIEELIPERVTNDTLIAILRLLLEERVSIRNLPLILEAIAEAKQISSSIDGIHEYVRQRLAFQIVAGIKRPDGSIPLIQLAPDWEPIFAANSVGREDGASDVALPPDLFQTLVQNATEKVLKASETGVSPAIVTSVRRRRFLSTVLASKSVQVPVLSFEELGKTSRPALVGVIGV